MKKTYYVNSSLLSQSGACLRRVYNTAIRGLTTRVAGYKPEYGNAYHRGLRKLYEGASLEKCLTAVEVYYEKNVFCPVGEWYSLDHCKASFLHYYLKEQTKQSLRPFQIEGKSLLEVTFADETFHETPDYRIVLVGTIDMVGIVERDGQSLVAVIDHKTTGSRSPDSFLEGFRLSPQGMLYVSQVRKNFPMLGNPAFMINGIFLSENKPPVFKQSRLFYFEDYVLERYIHYIKKDFIVRFENALRTGDWSYNFNACLSKYNSYCIYSKLCLLEKKEDQDAVAEVDFQQKDYNPLRVQNEDE